MRRRVHTVVDGPPMLRRGRQILQAALVIAACRITVELETDQADQERERQRHQCAENDLPTKGNLCWQQVRNTLTRRSTP